jgi:regulatory protein
MSRRPTQTRNPSDPAACYEAALKILGFRWNSSRELEQKLARKGFSDEAVEETVGRLLREQWIDDLRFAISKARALLGRNLGPGRAARELAAAGVDREIARNAMGEVFDDASREAALLALCRKKMRLLARGSDINWAQDDARRNKLFGWLLNQGYEAAAITATIRQIQNESKD